MRDNEFALIDQTLRDMLQRQAEYDRLLGQIIAVQTHRGETLEDIADSLKDMQRTAEAKLREMEGKQAKTDEKLQGLLDKITRWEAKVGAVIFLGSCVWVFLLALKEQILAFFKGAGG